MRAFLFACACLPLLDPCLVNALQQPSRLIFPQTRRGRSFGDRGGCGVPLHAPRDHHAYDAARHRLRRAPPCRHERTRCAATTTSAAATLTLDDGAARIAARAFARNVRLLGARDVVARAHGFLPFTGRGRRALASFLCAGAVTLACVVPCLVVVPAVWLAPRIVRWSVATAVAVDEQPSLRGSTCSALARSQALMRGRVRLFVGAGLVHAALEAAFQYAAPIALDVPLAAIDRAGFSALARGVQQLAEVALYLIDATEQVCFMFVFYDLLIAQEKTTKEADEETQQQEGASAEPPDATPP